MWDRFELHMALRYIKQQQQLEQIGRQNNKGRLYFNNNDNSNCCCNGEYFKVLTNHKMFYRKLSRYFVMDVQNTRLLYYI